MASISAAINLIVNGSSKIDQIIDKVAQLESIVNSISKVPLEINIEKAKGQLNSFDTQLKVTQETILSQEKNINTASRAIEGYSKKIESTKDQLSKLNPNTKKYNEILKRQEEAFTGLAKAKKDLSSAETALSKAQDRLDSDKQNTKEAESALRLSEAIDQLASDYLALGAAKKRNAAGEINKGQPAQSISGLTAQAEALKLVANNSAIASSQFNRYSIATQLASQKIYEARQQQLKGMAFGLSGGSGESVNIGRGTEKSIEAARNLVRSLVGSYGEVVKSEAALGLYAERLRSVQTLLPYTSDEFRLVEEAIAGVNQELSKIGLRGQTSKIIQAGPATQLGSLGAFRQQERFKKQINDELSRQVNIEERINRANINQNQSAELRNRLEEAYIALSEKRLDDARRISREIDRQRMSMERKNRAERLSANTTIVGVLGEGFFPVSGELPSTIGPNGEKIRNIVPGSPADRAAKAKKSLPRTTTFGVLGEGFLPISGELPSKIGPKGEKIRNLVPGSPAYKTALTKIEALQNRLVQLQEKALEVTGRYISESDISSQLSNFGKIEKFSSEFAENLREAARKLSRMIAGAEKPLATRLGGGAEVAARNKYARELEQASVTPGRTRATGAPRESTEKPLATRLGGGAEVIARDRYARELERASAQAQPKGLSVALGGGEQLRQQNAYEKEIRANAEKRISLNAIIEKQLIAVKNLLLDYKLEEKKNVDIVQEKAELIREINLIEGRSYDVNTRNVRIIGDTITKYRLLLNLKTKEAKLSDVYGMSNRPRGLSVPLGGGEQVREQYKYEQQIKANTEKRISLNAVIEKQLLFAKKLLSDYNLQEKKNVDLVQEKEELILGIQQIEEKGYEINAKNVRIIGDMITKYRLYLGLKVNEAKLNEAYGKPKAKTKTEAEEIEGRRVRLLQNALSLEGMMITAQGRGASLADERVQIEQIILRLKNLQNKASQDNVTLLAEEIQILRNRSKEEANKVVGSSGRLVPFLEKKFGAKKASAISEGLVGGAFPLLFGQGLGASIGGGIGGALGGMAGGGLGFGLSLAGTTIGSFLDQSVIKAKELGNAIQIASDNYGVLREKGLDFSSDLDRQVRLLKEQGKYVDAQQKMRDAVSLQTGDINALSTRGTTAALNSLEKAWRDVSAALGIILGTLATPIMFTLVLIAKVVQGIASTVNLIVTGLGFIVNLIPGIAKFSEFASEQALRGTKAYEDQLAEIDKQIDANVKLNKIATDKNNLISQAIGKSRVEYDIAVKKAEAEERRAKLQKEIEEFRASAPTGTPELRARAGIGEMQIRQRFFQEELGMVLSNAQQLFNEITDNNRRIAQQQRQYELEYADMVRQNRIAQQDLDLEAARKVQDIRIEMREKELQYTKQIADQELKAIRLADEERSFRRGINAAISGNPDDDVINTVETAIEKWRTGRREVEQEYAAKQQEIQLQAQKAEIALQRYKYDNALKIARVNEESQIKISKMQEQINIQNLEAERGRLEYRLNSLYAETQLLEANLKDRQRELDLLIGKVSTGVATPNAYGQMLLKTEQQYIDSQMRLVSDLRAKIDRVADMPAARLSPIGPAPMLTDPSASASAAMGDAAAQVRRYEEQLALLQKISGINKNDLELAKDLLAPGEQGLRQLNEALALQKRQIESRRIYNYLIDRGASREFAEENVRVIETYSALTAKIDALVKSIMSKKEYTEPGSRLPAIVNDLNAMSSGARVKSQTLLTGIAERYSPQQRVADEVDRIQEELNKLMDGANQVISAANAIGDAFSTSFKGIISGSMTAQEALASFFKNVAEHFLDMAAQIITKMIIIKILNAATSLLPVSNVASLGPVATAAGVVPRAGFMGPAFADGGMFANGIQPFAMGGIISSPTLFKFAQGGAMRTGLMGEAGPEGILPLSRGPGGRLGVDASGIDDNGGVNVTVNVDATGSKVQGDSGRAGELGRAISAAVQQELIKQKRNGGLLA